LLPPPGEQQQQFTAEVLGRGKKEKEKEELGVVGLQLLGLEKNSKNSLKTVMCFSQFVIRGITNYRR
jgi:hypothetical protein